MNTTSFETILPVVERAVTGLFNAFQPEQLVYHNLGHTQAVVKYAGEIAAAYPLQPEEHFILITAAWFHDTGQLFATQELHEAEGVKIANRFFEKFPYIQGPVITAIDHCILATRMPQRPQTLLEEILCDADLYHLGTDRFAAIDELVKKEAILRGQDVSGWDEATFRFLSGHQFHTEFCRSSLAKGKALNITHLKQKLQNR